jgi:hypothetical protein
VIEVIEGAAHATKFEGVDWLRDLLFLAFRGYFVSSIEDPERWPEERARTAIDTLLRTLDETTRSRAPSGRASFQAVRW